jgi:hypothetical protein
MVGSYIATKPPFLNVAQAKAVLAHAENSWLREWLAEYLVRTNPQPAQACGTILGDKIGLRKMSEKMKLWARIEKAIPRDDGTLEVHGIISSPIEDDQGEIVEPEAIKAALPRYMLYPTIRRQHNSDPIGTALEVEVGDDGKTRLVGKIVSDQAIKEIRHQVLRGFSIGGAVLQRAADNPRVITKLRLDEVSACDRPSNPECQIYMYKRSWFEPQPYWHCGEHNHVTQEGAAWCRVEREFGGGDVKKSVLLPSAQAVVNENMRIDALAAAGADPLLVKSLYQRNQAVFGAELVKMARRPAAVGDNAVIGFLRHGRP